MKKFIIKSIFFALSGILIPVSILIFLPATPRAKSSLLFAEIDKKSLLRATMSPRIIFIGGSNVSFGINSQLFKDSLKLNPVNMAIHGGIGLAYMLDSSLEYIQEGDIVVVLPEYTQYYNQTAYGSEELLRTLLDCSSFKDLGIVKVEQIKNMAPFMLNYIFSKLRKSEYVAVTENPIYGRYSFNEFGDANRHWHKDLIKVEPYNSIVGQINYDVFNHLQSYQSILAKKGAKMFISYPGYQVASFENSIGFIQEIRKILELRKFEVLGTPARYKMTDNLLYDSPYHLSKTGTDYRTNLLIQDLKLALNNN